MGNALNKKMAYLQLFHFYVSILIVITDNTLHIALHMNGCQLVRYMYQYNSRKLL